MESRISYDLQTTIRSQKQPSWYTIYTRPHHEKKIHSALELARIESYLPLQTTLKQWSDRKKKVTVPLFSCYVFVHITPGHYYDVLNTPGVIRYITFEGKAVAVPEKQILLIKNLLGNNIEVEEFTGNLQKGSLVRVICGPLLGLTGELINYANNNRVLIKIEEINKSLLINIPVKNLRPA